MNDGRLRHCHHSTQKGAEGFVRSRGAKRLIWAQVCFFFIFLSFFFTNIDIFYASLAPRTHPRYKSESVGRFYTSSDPRTHPRYKRKSVGRYYFSFTHTDPPSLQTRVGGSFLLLFYTYGPTLATNASRWAVIPYILHIRAHPCHKRESVGPYLTHGSPSLQKQVGGPFLLLLHVFS